VPASVKAKRDELLEEFHQATAPSAPIVDAEETLILEEVVEEKTEAPSPTAEEPQSPLATPDILAPEEKLDEPQAVEDEAEQPLDAEQEPPAEAFISTMGPARAAISHVEEAREPAKPSPAPLLDDATAAAGATLEDAVGDAVRSYIDQLIHQAVEELTPIITQEVVERLEATFPSIAERVIREEVEKLKRDA